MYLGLTVSSFFVGKILQHYSSRKVVAFATLLNAFMMILFGMSQYVSLLLFSRFCTGLTQAFPVVFAPVWLNEFAPKKSQTVWMSTLQLAPVLGCHLNRSFSLHASQQ